MPVALHAPSRIASSSPHRSPIGDLAVALAFSLVAPLLLCVAVAATGLNPLSAVATSGMI